MTITEFGGARLRQTHGCKPSKPYQLLLVASITPQSVGIAPLPLKMWGGGAGGYPAIASAAVVYGPAGRPVYIFF